MISAFTFRNIKDRAGALREMFRVLAPAGRLVILELTVPSGLVLRSLHRAYNRWLVPGAGRLLSRKEAYRYLVSSIENFPPPGEVLAMMANAGFAEPRHEPLTGGIVSLFTGGRKGHDN